MFGFLGRPTVSFLFLSRHTTPSAHARTFTVVLSDWQRKMGTNLPVVVGFGVLMDWRKGARPLLFFSPERHHQHLQEAPLDRIDGSEPCYKSRPMHSPNPHTPSPPPPTRAGQALLPKQTNALSNPPTPIPPRQTTTHPYRRAS